MAFSNQVKAVTLANISSAGFNNTFQLATTTTKPLIILRIINNSNQDVTISYDGVNDHDFVHQGTNVTIEFQTNSAPQNFIAQLPSHTPIYVKGAAAGAGLVYVGGYYIPQLP